MEDDILGLLDSSEQAFQDATPKPEYKGGEKGNFKRQGPNYWDQTEFKPISLDTETIHNAHKEYCVYVHTNGEDIPENMIQRLRKVFGLLNTKEYTLRYNVSKSYGVVNNSLKECNPKYELYLPWKSYNDELNKQPVMRTSDEFGYRVAFSYNKSFPKLPAAIRGILANLANTIFGKNGESKVEFIVVYTKDGRTSNSKDMDFKVVGNLPYILKIAKEQAIPVYNIANDDSLRELIELVNG